MIREDGHTSSFNLLKNKAQEIFDFAVATAHAFPMLKDALDNGKPLLRADYFGGNNSVAMLQSQILVYEQNLSTYLFLTSFSFFENYIKNLILEITESYNTSAITKAAAKAQVANPNLVKHKLKLRGAYDGRNSALYRKHSNELLANNYLEAEKAFDFFAKSILNNYTKDLKAYQIPDFLKDVLLVNLPSNFSVSFKKYSEMRNKIAHGTNPSVDFSYMKEANQFFKKSASIIDLQVASTFFYPANFIKS